MKLYDLLIAIDSTANISVRSNDDPMNVLYEGRKDEFPLRLFDLLRCNVAGIDADYANKSYKMNNETNTYTVGIIKIYVGEV